MNLKGFGRKLLWHNRDIPITEENLVDRSRDRCLGRDQNPLPPAYESRTLATGQLVLSMLGSKLKQNS